MKIGKKEKMRIILVALTGIILGCVLGEVAYREQRKARAEAARVRAELFRQEETVELPYVREEVRDIGVIYEEVVELRAMSQAEEDALIAGVVMSEAGNQGFVGQVAVAAVILNRMEARGMSAVEVVYEPHQFAAPRTEASESCFEAVRFARENRDLFPRDMFYFRAGKYHAFGKPYMVIGDHYFSTAE